MAFFDAEDRDRVSRRVLEMASSDVRVVAGAVVGSLALNEGDQWSDLDLTFAVTDGVPISEVLEDWTRTLMNEFQAVQLFDLPSGPSLYRVLLLPNCLQFDLSFTPAAQFGAIGPKFKLLFGSAVERSHAHPPDARDLFGYAVHHALHARICIERERYWQAEYWISGVRDYALSLACRRRQLPAYYGRGFDDLPPNVLDALKDAFVGTVDRDELLRALRCAVNGLLREAVDVQALANSVEPQLRSISRV